MLVTIIKSNLLFSLYSGIGHLAPKVLLDYFWRKHRDNSENVFTNCLGHQGGKSLSTFLPLVAKPILRGQQR